jgi:hypothetical protein
MRCWRPSPDCIAHIRTALLISAPEESPMYSESDIEQAVASGVLTPEAAAACARASPPAVRLQLVDEESFRLMTGFNDIFVSIAAILLLVAVGWIGGNIGYRLTSMCPPMTAIPLSRARARCSGAGAVAIASWLLAEYFTRRRRMALPSILLLGTFAFAIGALFGGLLGASIGGPATRQFDPARARGSAHGDRGLWLHWRRFHVPITIAALTGALGDGTGSSTSCTRSCPVSEQAMAAWMSALARRPLRCSPSPCGGTCPILRASRADRTSPSGCISVPRR